MRKTRIAIVHYLFGCGGAEHMVSELASHINKNLFDVRVICIYGQRKGNEMERAVEDSGASISYLGFKDSESRLKGIYRTWNELNSFKPDVVHTHLGAVQYCLPWVLAHGVKLVHTVHNVPEMETPGSALKKIMAWMYRTGRAVPVAISKQNRVLTARYYKIAENVVELVNNPVDVEFFHPSNKSDLRDFRFDFINVAGLRPQKNQKILLRAFANTVARHPASRLCIVGDGSERQELENLANELGLSDAVEFLGQISEKTKVRDALWSSKVFILSSDYEGLPLSAIEAMACGLPVISTDVGGMTDIVRGNGALVPARDVDMLSSKMCYAMELGFGVEASSRSRELACRFSVNECTSSYEAIYLDCVAQR